MKKTNLNKRRLNRKLLLLNPLIGFLCSLSVFGIGFGGWSMSDYAHINDTSFGIGDLIDLPSYIQDFKVTTFKIAPDGIIQNETVMYDANIQIDFKINVKNGLFLNYQPVNNLLKLNIRVENTGTFNFFTTEIVKPNPAVKYTINNGLNSANGDSNVSINAKVINFTIEYSDQDLINRDYLNYSIQVGLDFNKYKTDFTTSIYNKLGDKPMAFNFFMGVSE